MKILFDSQLSAYKQPFGAVRTGEPVQYCVQCSQKDAEIWMILRNDAETFEQRVKLLADAADEAGMTSYRCTVILGQADLYFYRFEVGAKEGVLFCGRDGCRLKTGDWLPEWQLTVYDASFETPAWAKGGILYQIFPDRFAKSKSFQPRPAPGERISRADWGGLPQSALDTPNYAAKDFFGGNLRGILDHLGRLEELGVTLLYLNPIFEGPENHRYGTGDYQKIDPWLGDNEDFRQLCQACKNRGIRLILDGVFNHTGADSRYFNRFGHYPGSGAYQSKDSPFFGWYRFARWPEEYECWWNFPNLPNVDENSPDYTAFIAGDGGVLEYWQALGCKGWRLDVADELPDSFLDRLRAAVKSFDPDAIILGEVWEDASNKISLGGRRRYLLGKQLDSVMNYPFRAAIVDFALTGDSGLFRSRILEILEHYPKPALDTAMNMLSTHDTVRILNALGVEHMVKKEEKGRYTLTAGEYGAGKARLKAAAFLQFTLPGIPSIYYGDEAGLTGFEDPFNRGCYPWGSEDTELLDFFKGLAAFRKSRQSDLTADFSLIWEENGLFAFTRGSLLCAVNFGGSQQRITVPKSPDGRGAFLFSGGEATRDGASLLLPPGGYCAAEIGGLETK